MDNNILFAVFWFVCTVTDFYAKVKASGIKFCTAVHQRPRQGIINFLNFAPSEAPNRTNRPARGPRPPACKHYRIDVPM